MRLTNFWRARCAQLSPQVAVVLRLESTFGALVAVQAIHSIEECVGRLWESYPPARFLVGLISTNHAQNFALLNVALVAFGAWCYFWPVRGRWVIARGLLWFWVAVEIINGLAHSMWAFWSGGYTPGVATAPLLLILAAYLARQLLSRSPASQAAA
jgi:hypothetical protein